MILWALLSPLQYFPTNETYLTVKDNDPMSFQTSKYRPSFIEKAIAFCAREEAAAFQRHLKFHSG
jgi:hypothetical protein